MSPIMSSDCWTKYSFVWNVSFHFILLYFSLFFSVCRSICFNPIHLDYRIVYENILQFSLVQNDNSRKVKRLKQFLSEEFQVVRIQHLCFFTKNIHGFFQDILFCETSCKMHIYAQKYKISIKMNMNRQYNSTILPYTY